MVTSLNAILLVIALGAPGNPPESGKVTVSITAVQATSENRSVQRDAAQPKRPTSPFLQQGFAPGLRNNPRGGQNEDRRIFGEGLEDIREAASTLPYDTYKKIKSQQLAIDLNKESTFAIDDRYKLRLTPRTKDSRGRLRVNVAVDELTTRDNKPQVVTALETTSLLAPNKYLVLGGRLPLDDGQLVIFITTPAER